MSSNIAPCFTTAVQRCCGKTHSSSKPAQIQGCFLLLTPHGWLQVDSGIVWPSLVPAMQVRSVPYCCLACSHHTTMLAARPAASTGTSPGCTVVQCEPLSH